MALSTYFDTPTFRAVDDDATDDQRPLTSALEAQLASSQEWLHRNAGGHTPLLGVPGALASTGYNSTFHVAATWASLFAMPFLVTRGLKEIRVTMLGTVEAFNINTRLELAGLAADEVTWVIGGSATANVVRTATLVLDEPAQVEYETDLILWGKSQIDTALSSSVNQATIDAGKLETNPAAMTTSPNATLVALNTRWNGTGFPALVIWETLFRNPAALDYAAVSTVGAAILSERIGGTAFVGEIELGRITTRSFFIETRSA